MKQIQEKNSSAIAYFFTRSKDIYEEGGKYFITLFARLTLEFTETAGSEIHKKTESVWVDIEEFDMEKAEEKTLALPNRINEYEIPKEVFLELVKIASNCPRELYYITPFSYSKET